MNVKLNKRASMSSTLTWVAAIFVILIILAVFEFIAFGILGVSSFKGFIFGDTNDANVQSQTSGDLISSEMLVSLMNKNVELDGESMKFKELILKWADMADNEKLNGKYSNNEIRTIISSQAHSILIGLNRDFYFHAEKNPPNLETIISNKDVLWEGRDIDSIRHNANSIEAQSRADLFGKIGLMTDILNNKRLTLNTASSVILFNKNHEPIEVRLLIK